VQVFNGQKEKGVFFAIYIPKLQIEKKAQPFAKTMSNY
jgi:hypothetical protein